MTPRQLQLLGMAKTWACKNIPEFDDPQYRLVLRNIGHVQEDGDGRISGKGLSNSGFEQVMAWFESSGWAHVVPPSGGSAQCPPKGGTTYWTSKAGRASRGEISDREIRLIEQLGSDICSLTPDFSLPGFIHRMSNHRTTQVENLYEREAHNVIEALKQIISRPASTPHGATDATKSDSRCVVAPLRETEFIPPVPAPDDAGAMTQEIPF